MRKLNDSQREQSIAKLIISRANANRKWKLKNQIESAQAKVNRLIQEWNKKYPEEKKELK